MAYACHNVPLVPWHGHQSQFAQRQLWRGLDHQWISEPSLYNLEQIADPVDGSIPQKDRRDTRWSKHSETLCHHCLAQTQPLNKRFVFWKLNSQTLSFCQFKIEKVKSGRYSTPD